MIDSPSDELPQNEVKMGKLLKITKLFRVVKLTKIGKASQFMEKLDEVYLDLVVSAVTLMLLFFVFFV